MAALRVTVYLFMITSDRIWSRKLTAGERVRKGPLLRSCVRAYAYFPPIPVNNVLTALSEIRGVM